MKSDRGKVIARNVEYIFDNCCLATRIKGTGELDVYQNMLIVKITKGSIKINPEFDNPTYTVGDIYLSLGKFAEREKGIWTRFNNSSKIRIDQQIISLQDSIDISGLEFEIPYEDESELIDSWIVITTTNESRRGLNHAHSIHKKQKFY